MVLTSLTISFTCSTEGSGASTAGIILTSCSVSFDSRATFLRRVSLFVFLSIVFVFSEVNIVIIRIDHLILETSLSLVRMGEMLYEDTHLLYKSIQLLDESC